MANQYQPQPVAAPAPLGAAAGTVVLPAPVLAPNPSAGPVPPAFGNLNPDVHSEGSAIPTGNQLLYDARFTTFIYGGSSGNVGIGAMITWVNDQGQANEQFYSIGDASRWQPSPDGLYILPVAGSGQPNKNSNFGFLMSELKVIGFPLNRIDGQPITALKGLYCTLIEKQQPKPITIFKH